MDVDEWEQEERKTNRYSHGEYNIFINTNHNDDSIELTVQQTQWDQVFTNTFSHTWIHNNMRILPNMNATISNTVTLMNTVLSMKDKSLSFAIRFVSQKDSNLFQRNGSASFESMINQNPNMFHLYYNHYDNDILYFIISHHNGNNFAYYAFPLLIEKNNEISKLKSIISNYQIKNDNLQKQVNQLAAELNQLKQEQKQMARNIANMNANYRRQNENTKTMGVNYETRSKSNECIPDHITERISWELACDHIKNQRFEKFNRNKENAILYQNFRNTVVSKYATGKHEVLHSEFS